MVQQGKDSPLSDRLTATYHALPVKTLIRWSSFFLPADAPFWVRVLVFNLELGLLLALPFLFSSLANLGVYLRILAWVLATQLVWFLLFFPGSETMLAIFRRDVEPAVLRPGALYGGFRPETAWLLAFIPGGIIVALGFIPSYRYLLGLLGSPLALSLLILVVLIYFSAFFSCLSFWNLLLTTITKAVRGGVRLHRLSPRKSPFVTGALAIAQRVGVIVAITVALDVLAAVFSLPELLGQFGLITMLVAVGIVVLVVVALFLRLQAVISDVVEGERSRTLAELQEELDRLYEARLTLDAEDRQRFTMLTALHSGVQGSGLKAYNGIDLLRTFAPLILPLASLLVGASALPESLRGIIQLLLNVLQ